MSQDRLSGAEWSVKSGHCWETGQWGERAEVWFSAAQALSWGPDNLVGAFVSP
jgi:hypothetical protein